jgi:hypothetical protein
MKDTRTPHDHAPDDRRDKDHRDRNAAIVAADDTGLLSGEIQITDAELREGEVTPTE